jgi:Na+/melibiose symporter-like transporter
MSAARAKPRRVVLLAYALPGFAFAMPTIPVYVLLPSWYAEDLGLGLATVGLILLLSRAFDVLSDPLAGLLSDGLVSRWGRRKPWILAGAVVACVALFQLFAPPARPSAGYLLFWITALYIGWTFIAVPYTAWGAELSDDYHGRASITGAREAAMILGVVAAAALPGMAAGFGLPTSAGLSLVAWCAVGSGTVLMAALLRLVPDRSPQPGTASSMSIRSWRSLAGNAPFRRLLLAWFVNGLANGVPAVLFPIYLERRLGADEATQAWLILVYFLMAALSVPLWLFASRHLGKHRTWCAAMILACGVFATVPFIPPGDIVWFAAICVLTGSALGADLALPPAMQADVIDIDRLETGLDRSGIFFAFWSMATKLALGLAGFFALTLLDLGDGASETPAWDEQQTLMLAVIYAWLPIIFKVISVVAVWRHPVTEERHAAISAALAQRAARRTSQGDAQTMGHGP